MTTEINTESSSRKSDRTPPREIVLGWGVTHTVIVYPNGMGWMSRITNPEEDAEHEKGCEEWITSQSHQK